MRIWKSLWVVLVVGLVVGAGCGLLPEPDSAHLAFLAPMNVDSGERFHVSLGVENLGADAFRGFDAFNGAMTLSGEDATEVGRIEVTTLWQLPPGETAWPASFAARLPAGPYRLTWGAPGYGSVTVDFTIVELEGRLYLGEEAIAVIGGATTDEREYGSIQSLVDLARVNLAQRLGVELPAVEVQSVEEAAFPDASLGVPEPDQAYAQVLTPGYVITLKTEGETYRYHASDRRLVFVPPQESAPTGDITIEGVQVVRGERVIVRGASTLPDGTCLGSELWADGEPQSWWPGETCVPVHDSFWEIIVPLGEGGAPADLDASTQYMVRAFQKDGPNIVAVFAFDLATPPTPAP